MELIFRHKEPQYDKIMKHPQVDDIRYRTKFCILPYRVNGFTFWFEHVTIVEKYSYNRINARDPRLYTSKVDMFEWRPIQVKWIDPNTGKEVYENIK